MRILLSCIKCLHLIGHCLTQHIHSIKVLMRSSLLHWIMALCLSHYNNLLFQISLMNMTLEYTFMITIIYASYESILSYANIKSQINILNHIVIWRWINISKNTISKNTHSSYFKAWVISKISLKRRLNYKNSNLTITKIAFIMFRIVLKSICQLLTQKELSLEEILFRLYVIINVKANRRYSFNVMS